MKSYEMQSPTTAGYTLDEMRTGERTAAAKLKWVVIVDPALGRST